METIRAMENSRENSETFTTKPQDIVQTISQPKNRNRKKYVKMKVNTKTFRCVQRKIGIFANN